MSVAMALAEVNHHSAPRRPKTARARGWTRPEQIVDVPVPDVLVPRRLPPPQEDPATLVPLLAQQETSIDGKTLHFLIWRTFMDRKALEEQERKEQEVVEWMVPQHFSVATPRATALDVPVLADDDGFFDVVSPALAVLPAPVVEYVSPAPLVLPAPGVEYVSPASAVISIPAVAEQVIEVPILALPGCAVQRAALSEPQLVEQLVEVPTVLSFSLLQQRTAEQIIDFPVPGRGEGARGGLQGLPQGQGSTASVGEQTIVPSRVGLHGFSPGQGSTSVSSAERFSERIMEQIVNIPRGGLSPGVFSASSAGAADEGPAGRGSGMGKAIFTGDTASRALSSHGKAGFAGEDAPRGSSSRGKAGSTGDDAPRVPFGAQSGVGRHRPRPGQGSTALRGRRFTGQVFVEPDAAGRVGFIESASAQAELASVGDFRFSASYRGRFAEGDYVWFSVGSVRPGAFLGLRFLSVVPVLVFIAV